MNAQLESSALQEAIRVIARIAPPDSGNITIQSNGKKLFVHSQSETARCSVNLPATVEGKAGSFALGLNAIKDATKGRGKLELKYEKTLCKIKSGSYKCELATVDSLEVEAQEDEKGKKIEFSTEQAVWLKDAAATVALRPTVLLNQPMPLSVKLTDKGAFVACYDVTHMAFLQSKEVNGQIEVKLPIEMFTSVLDAFGKAPFTMQMSKSSLYVQNKLITVALALPQEEENELQIGEVIAAAKGSKESKGTEIVLDKAEVLTFLDNARSIATKERSELKIQISDGKLKFSVTTVQGVTAAILKAKAKNCECAIDFEYFDEAVRKCGDQVSMKLVKDEFIAINLKNSTIVLSLNQQ